MLVHSFANKIKNIELFFRNIYRSSTGFIKILILSKYNNDYSSLIGDSCIILGNGPSLKDSLINFNESFLNKPIVCVNHFANSIEFEKYKPSFYVLLDPSFFILKNRDDVSNTINALKDKTKWPLTLFVPYLYRTDKDVQFFLTQKSFIKIQFFNYTIVKGFEFIGFRLFKKNLAMPQFYNVLGASIFLAINMGCKKVWVVGADHSWFKEIHVPNDNSLCLEDKHFYDIEKQKLIHITDPFSEKKPNVGDFFQALYRVFDSYYILNRYATYMNAKIYNASEFSYIDAFERKKLDEIDNGTSDN